MVKIGSDVFDQVAIWILTLIAFASLILFVPWLRALTLRISKESHERSLRELLKDCWKGGFKPMLFGCVWSIVLTVCILNVASLPTADIPLAAWILTFSWIMIVLLVLTIIYSAPLFVYMKLSLLEHTFNAIVLAVSSPFDFLFQIGCLAALLALTHFLPIVAVLCFPIVLQLMLKASHHAWNLATSKK
jgi:uncharacterized membrane protein YesL